MKKAHFTVDQDNQLLIGSPALKQLLVVNGKFSLDTDNNLIYLLNETVGWRREYGLPNRIKFKGRWSLNENYDLELYLDKTEEQFNGDYLCLKGRVLYAGQESFVFQLNSRDKRRANRLSLLKFSGIWQADEFNRIIFQVKKKATPDTLAFKGIWQVNANQQISYEYEKIQLKTKRKIKDTLVFTGFWQVFSANRLSYILSYTLPRNEILRDSARARGSSASRFDFRAHLETPNLYPKKSVIKYRLGVGIRRDLQPALSRIIYLYGTWKFSRRLGLSFEMHYGRAKVKRLTFNTQVNLSQRDKIIFQLTDNRGRRLGISVIYRHRFLL